MRWDLRVIMGSEMVEIRLLSTVRLTPHRLIILPLAPNLSLKYQQCQMSPMSALLGVTDQCYYWLKVTDRINYHAKCHSYPRILTHLHQFDFVIVQKINKKIKNYCSRFRFYSLKLLLRIRMVLDCVHKATDNQMVIPVGSALSMHC